MLYSPANPRSLKRVLAGALLASACLGASVGAHSAFATAGLQGSVASPRWLTWNASTKTTSLTLTAAYNNTLQGFNFNGAGKGRMTVTIPVGAHIKVTFTNKGVGPAPTHSFLITPYADRNTTGTFPLAFKGASSSHPTAGTAKGRTEHISFVANKTGTYAVVCAVPGHAAAGMWDVFQVRTGGSATIRFN
jgi:sulfocyanin